MYSSKYSNKVVLITGTSRGVGKILAKHFLSDGATVVGIDRTISEDTIKIGKFYGFKCDLSQPQAIVDTFQHISVQFPRIDILINNAAVLTSQYSTKMSIEDATAMVMVDLLGVFVVSRECAKLMKKVDYGRIINISSMAVSLEPMGDSVYASCKAGITTMANIMAKEFAFMNVTCNTLAISAIKTDMLAQLNMDKIDKIINGLTVPRYATADDITNVVDFFASESSSNITAQTLYLGGVHA